jgi:hypothetical protein
LGPLVRLCIKARTYGYQESANASTKKAASLCCFRNAFMLPMR